MATSSAPPNTKYITVVNTSSVDNSSRVFYTKEAGKLPLLTIKETFQLTEVELCDTPGILSYGYDGISNDVPFSFFDTIRSRGVPNNH